MFSFGFKNKICDDLPSLSDWDFVVSVDTTNKVEYKTDAKEVNIVINSGWTYIYCKELTYFNFKQNPDIKASKIHKISNIKSLDLLYYELSIDEFELDKKGDFSNSNSLTSIKGMFCSDSKKDHTKKNIKKLDLSLLNAINVVNIDNFMTGLTKLEEFIPPKNAFKSCVYFRGSFAYLKSIKNFPFIDVSKGKYFGRHSDAHSWENGNYSLKTSGCWLGCGFEKFPELDFSSAEDLSKTWLNCKNLTKLPNVSAKYMRWTFAGIPVKKINKLPKIKRVYAQGIFAYTDIEEIDINNIFESQDENTIVEFDMALMGSKLNKVVSKVNLPNVSSLAGTFSGTKIKDIELKISNKLRFMSSQTLTPYFWRRLGIFSNCKELERIYIDGDTSKVEKWGINNRWYRLTNGSGAFSHTPKLVELNILDYSGGKDFTCLFNNCGLDKFPSIKPKDDSHPISFKWLFKDTTNATCLKGIDTTSINGDTSYTEGMFDNTTMTSPNDDEKEQIKNGADWDSMTCIDMPNFF